MCKHASLRVKLVYICEYWEDTYLEAQVADHGEAVVAPHGTLVVRVGFARQTRRQFALLAVAALTPKQQIIHILGRYIQYCDHEIVPRAILGSSFSKSGENFEKILEIKVSQSLIQFTLVFF